MLTSLTRALSLVFTPFLLLVSTALLIGNDKNDVNPVLAFAGVIAGTAAVCILLAIWSVRFANSESYDNRFSISTIVIVTSILAIYMAYFRQLPFDWDRPEQLSFYSISMLVICFFIFSSVATFVLALFTESALFSAVRCKRRISQFLRDFRDAV